ncbi:hypothetical protein AVEN_86379-1 [Araneus ventricosus]|uniref:Transposase Tc1-like domain-containing protein n=1 Tax=Araneus ventricosus TaxID=182803 RepID=A0A4Y2KEB2_ARAVE|nr:hypothetical protein AVEN_86379-1 [Araneus ventricosus]
MRTVQRTVINVGSQNQRPTRVPLLTALHKALLLSWARQHYHWTVDDWKHVTWSDESRFQLYRTDARVRIWRQHHESIDPVCQHGTIQSGGASVMVWDVRSWRDMGPLIRLETTLTGDRYLSISPIIYTHLCPLCIPTDWDNSSRTMRHPTRRELLPSGSRNTLLTLDTSIGHLNPQR